MNKEKVYELIYSENIDDFLLGMRILHEHFPEDIKYDSGEHIPNSIYYTLKEKLESKCFSRITAFKEFKKEMGWTNQNYIK